MREYGDLNKKLSSVIGWHLMMKNCVILNKNGTFQKTIEIRGHDLEVSTKEIMKAYNNRLNNVLKRLEGNVTLNVDSIRVKSNKYLKGDFKNLLGKIIDTEREEYFNKGNHYETRTYITITYIVPLENTKKMEQFLIRSELERYEKEYYTEFLKEFKIIKELLKSAFLYVEELTEEETLTYLHSLVSSKKQKVILPKSPIYLSNYLCDSTLVGGLQLKLDNEYITCIALSGFPHVTYPCFFNNLNSLDIEYRWNVRFRAIEKQKALSKLNGLWNKFFADRLSLWQMVMKEITGNEPDNQNEHALDSAQEIKEQIRLTQGDYVSQGYYLNTLILRDSNIKELEKKVAIVNNLIKKLGFTTIVETYNAVDSYLGSLAGDVYHNERDVSILNSLTTSHLFPLSTVWAGDEMNKHLDQPALIYTQTKGSTPFRLNLHEGEVGHTAILGRTGSGKSVLLGDIAFSWSKYINSKVYIFDKDRSSLVLTKANNGNFYDVGEDELSFQPLKNIDDEREKEWANGFILDILEQERIEINSNVKKIVWDSLSLVAKDPVEYRTISALRSYCNLKEIKEALETYTQAGALGKYFDSSSDNLTLSDWSVFEMAKVIDNKQAIMPLLNYLFHKIEIGLNGKDPTLIILDECWIFLTNKSFSEKIKDWLKTFRKKNAILVFATQELSDVKKSSIYDTIRESCVTKIYLGNPNADSEVNKELYKEFGLNSKEIQILSEMKERKEYYLKQNQGSRVFDLALGEIELSFIASTDLENQKEAIKISEKTNSDEFCQEWLKYKNIKI